MNSTFWGFGVLGFWGFGAPAQLQVRLHEEVEWAAPAEAFRMPSAREMMTAEELAELDEEIEFRRAPEFHDLVLETQAIPGNIIEFPRELVASRKARPRLAEGPLRADGTPEPQLRIFEVEPAQIAAEPEMPIAAEAPEWQGLLLNAEPSAATRSMLSPQLEAQLQLDQQVLRGARVAASALRGHRCAVCRGRTGGLRGGGGEDCRATRCEPCRSLCWSARPWARSRSLP